MLAGVPDLLRCNKVLCESLPLLGVATRSPKSGLSEKSFRSPTSDACCTDEFDGDGLRDRNRCGVGFSSDELRFRPTRSFSSMIRAGDFMSTLGRPTLENVEVDAADADAVGFVAASCRWVFRMNDDADVMNSSLLPS